VLRLLFIRVPCRLTALEFDSEFESRWGYRFAVLRVFMPLLLGSIAVGWLVGGGVAAATGSDAGHGGELGIAVGGLAAVVYVAYGFVLATILGLRGHDWRHM
jgi:hypothetical protein